MTDGLPVDPTALREEVKTKYRAVAVNPHGGYHFHTGRPLAQRLGYDEAVVARMPESAIEALAVISRTVPSNYAVERRIFRTIVHQIFTAEYAKQLTSDGAFAAYKAECEAQQ